MSEERMDLLPSHQLCIIEDPINFDGATPHQVQEHFATIWVQNELTRVLEDPGKRTCRVHGPGGIEHDPAECLMGTRYNFCLFVDQICLESLDETPSRPVVKFFAKDWEKIAPEDYHSHVYNLRADHGYEDGMTNDPGEDVGWMYIEVSDYVEWFDMFVEPINWLVWYRRPPRLGNWDSLPGLNVMLPGGWRKKGNPMFSCAGCKATYKFPYLGVILTAPQNQNQNQNQRGLCVRYKDPILVLVMSHHWYPSCFEFQFGSSRQNLILSHSSTLYSPYRTI